MSTHHTEPRRPYVGLRPFQRDDSPIFFGRDDQIQELLTRLQERRMVVVVGPSGCGKSSLVTTGLLTELETGMEPGAEESWETITFRPGTSPYTSLAEALLRNELIRSRQPAELSEADNAITLLAARLRTGEWSLTKFLTDICAQPPTDSGQEGDRTSPTPNNLRILVIADQFEEIFRYFRETIGLERDNLACFVNSLLEIPRHEEAFYLIITMRSDFLGDCMLFAGLPEAVNDTQYLTPRLSPEQLDEVILGPAKVFGASVEPGLAALLHVKLGERADDLPLLQHALSRIWLEAAKRYGKEKSAERRYGSRRNPDYTLAVRDLYAAAGKSAEQGDKIEPNDFLNRHADDHLEAYCESKSIEEASKRRWLAARIFRRLADPTGQRRDTRRPTTLQELVAICDVGLFDDVEEHVRQLINHFMVDDLSSSQAPERSTPLAAGPQQIDEAHFLVKSEDKQTGAITIDISHEALIRGWKQFRVWIREEERDADVYRQMCVLGNGYQNKNIELLAEQAYAHYANAYREIRANADWAARYERGDDWKARVNAAESSIKNIDTFLSASAAAIKWNKSMKRIIGVVSAVLGSAIALRVAITSATQELVTDNTELKKDVDKLENAKTEAIKLERDASYREELNRILTENLTMQAEAKINLSDLARRSAISQANAVWNLGAESPMERYDAAQAIGGQFRELAKGMSRSYVIPPALLATLDTLTKLATRDPVAQVRWAALNTLLHAQCTFKGHDIRVNECRTAFQEALRDNNTQVQRTAAEAIRKLGYRPLRPSTAKVRSPKGHEDWYVLNRKLLSNDAARWFAEQYLDDPTWQVREAVAGAAQRHEEPSLARQLYSDKHPVVAQRARAYGSRKNVPDATPKGKKA